MGVVHKLTQEIMDFIVLQKRDEPSLSCRSIAKIVFERFGENVSKSSINNLLKEERLSSPVGRRSTALRTHKKQFKIPDTKRNQIQSDLSSSFGMPENAVQTEVHNVNTEKADLMDGAGAVLLRAAEWDLAKGPILADILDLQGEQNNQFLRVLSLLHGFHIDSIEKIHQYCGTGLWKLADFNQGGDFFVRWLDQFQDWKQYYLRFSIKSPGFFTKVSYFKLYLEDKMVLYLDTQGGAVWSSNVHSDLYASLAQATEALAKQILNNVQSVVLCGMCPKKQGQKTTSALYFQNLVEAFEGVHGKKIEMIGLIDEKSRELARFNADIHVRREFIAGVWPWQTEFQELLDSKKEMMSGKIPVSDSTPEIHFKEVKLASIFGQRGSVFKALRGFLLYEAFNSVPFAGLLSNLDSQQEAQKVVSAYLARWPYLTRGSVYQKISTGDRDDLSKKVRADNNRTEDDFLKMVGKSSVFGLTQAVGEMLNAYVQDRFFPEQYCGADFFTMHNRFYRLQGTITEGNRDYCVILNTSSEAPAYKEDLIFAAQAVNEAAIQTSRQKTLKILLK